MEAKISALVTGSGKTQELADSINNSLSKRNIVWMTCPFLLNEGRGDIQMEVFNIIPQFSNHLIHSISTLNNYDIEEEVYDIKLNSHDD